MDLSNDNRHVRKAMAPAARSGALQSDLKKKRFKRVSWHDGLIILYASEMVELPTKLGGAASGGAGRSKSSLRSNLVSLKHFISLMVMVADILEHDIQPAYLAWICLPVSLKDGIVRRSRLTTWRMGSIRSGVSWSNMSRRHWRPWRKRLAKEQKQSESTSSGRPQSFKRKTAWYTTPVDFGFARRCAMSWLHDSRNKIWV